MKEGTTNYLGTRRRQDEEGVTLDMDEYIENLEEVSVKPVSGDLLNEK